MRRSFFILFFIAVYVLPFSLFGDIPKVASVAGKESQSEDHHDDDGKEHVHDDDDGSEHAHDDEDSDGHAHHDDHDEEENASVGPDKGILEIDEDLGFKLSPEATKNFDLQVQKLSGQGPWSVSRSSLLHSGEEVNVFRRRQGFYKRIDFKEVRRTATEITLSSVDLRNGDELVVAGLGFLRIAEMAASGGVAHGHSH